MNSEWIYEVIVSPKIPTEKLQIFLLYPLITFNAEILVIFGWHSHFILILKTDKGQLNSEWIYEVIVSPKMLTKKFPYCCTTKQTRIIAKKLPTLTKKSPQKNCYDLCLFGRAEIWKNFGWHFGRNNDLINSFWI